jgi:kumamolisin
MQVPTNTAALSALNAVEEALSKLAGTLTPTPPSQGGTRSIPYLASARNAESGNPFRCRNYIKWPSAPGLTPRAGGPWQILNLCKAYDFPTNLAGGGVIGILEFEGGWAQSDLDLFSQKNGLPPIQGQDISVDGTNNNTAPNPNADGEVALDIQVAAAAYFYATGQTPTIKVLWAKNDFRSFPLVFKAATDADCDVLSISWGADEIRWNTVPGSAQQVEAAAQAATAKGCILFAASGDNSSGDSDPGANVDLPSACPHVIGCGGTSKTTFSEVVWGNGNPSGNGTGGGYSNNFPPQPWQIGAPAGPGRMVPDVAANADPNTGYLIVLNGNQVQIGGTSAVAPFYSGLFASFGRKLGFITPTLWQNPAAFVDIIQGTNGGFTAGVGPDPCTGLGVPRGRALASLFSSSMMGGRQGNPLINQLPVEITKAEVFRAPSNAALAARQGEAPSANVSSIVSVASQLFTFKENSNTPGRFLEQSVVVNVPAGAGWFTCIPHVMGAFTSSDFQTLTERPLGQFFVNVGMRGNNLVCTVRLTDSNSDDPIYIEVSGTVVFYS